MNATPTSHFVAGASTALLLFVAGPGLAFVVARNWSHESPPYEEPAMQKVTPPTVSVPINDQIAAIKRRLLQMENTFPRYVREHRMTQEKADKEIQRFRAALETLITARALNSGQASLLELGGTHGANQ